MHSIGSIHPLCTWIPLSTSLFTPNSIIVTFIVTIEPSYNRTHVDHVPAIADAKS